MVARFGCASLVIVVCAAVAGLLPPIRWPYPDRLAPIPPDEAAIDNESPYDAVEKWARNGSQAGLHLLNPTRVAHFDSRIRASLAPPFRVLDIGCGGGLVSNALATLEGYEAIEGIDLSPTALQYARDTAAELGSGAARVQFQNASVYDLPFAAGHFDAVIISDVLEHLLDLPKALAEAARVLRAGGVLLFDTIERSLPAFVVAILGAEYIVRIIKKGTHDWRLFVRPAELEQALRAVGFSEFAHEAFQPSIRALFDLSAFNAGLLAAENMVGTFYTEPPSPLMVSYIGHAVRSASSDKEG